MKKLTISMTISVLLITGCNPKYYSPSSQNVPLFTQKGEKNLTVIGNDNQLEFQGAYALTDKFSVKADVSIFNPKDLDNGDGGSGHNVELGAGYFKPLNNNFVFENYVIAGIGKMENHMPSTVSANPQTTGDISANIFRYGIQPHFGYKTKYFTAGVSTRFTGLNYSNIKGDLIHGNENQVDYLNNNKSHFLIEPALTLRGGIENIKLQLQLGGSLNITNSDFRQDDSFATIGLSFYLK